MAMNEVWSRDGVAAASTTTEVAAVAPLACLLRGLGDGSRLAIVHHLLAGEHRVVDLVAHLGLAQSTVSKHLACLLECGVVQVRAAGRASIYSLAEPDATRELLAATERLLALTGDAAVRCASTGAGGSGR